MAPFSFIVRTDRFSGRASSIRLLADLAEAAVCELRAAPVQFGCERRRVAGDPSPRATRCGFPGCPATTLHRTPQERPRYRRLRVSANRCRYTSYRLLSYFGEMVRPDATVPADKIPNQLRPDGRDDRIRAGAILAYDKIAELARSPVAPSLAVPVTQQRAPVPVTQQRAPAAVHRVRALSHLCVMVDRATDAACGGVRHWHGSYQTRRQPVEASVSRSSLFRSAPAYSPC